LPPGKENSALGKCSKGLSEPAGAAGGGTKPSSKLSGRHLEQEGKKGPTFLIPRPRIQNRSQGKIPLGLSEGESSKSLLRGVRPGDLPRAAPVSLKKQSTGRTKKERWPSFGEKSPYRCQNATELEEENWGGFSTGIKN